MRTRRTLALVLAMLMVAAIPAMAESNSFAQSLLEYLDEPAYQATYDALLSKGMIFKGDTGDEYKGIQQLLNDVGFKTTVDGNIGEGTMTDVGHLAMFISKQSAMERIIDEVDIALYEEMLCFALYLKDATSLTFALFGTDDMVNRMMYYEAARMMIQDENVKGAVELYERLKPYRNSESLLGAAKLLLSD